MEGYVLSSYERREGCYSLLNLVEKNGHLLRNKLKSLIASQLVNYLSEQKSFNTNEIQQLLLYSSGLVEQSTIKTSIWLDGLRLLALNHELKGIKYFILTYRGSNRSIHKCLKKLCFQRNLKYNWELSIKKEVTFSWINSLYLNLPLLVQAKLFLLNYLFKRWPFRRLSIPKWIKCEKSLFFFSYFFHLDQEEGESGKFYSKQWENLPRHLQKQGFQLNWIHLFLKSRVIPNPHTGIKWLNRLRMNSHDQGHHAVFDQYLDLLIVARVIRDWFKSILLYIRGQKQAYSYWEKDGFEWLWPVFQKDWKDSWIGPVAIQNLLWIHLFDKVLASLPRQRVGLYLLENQGWERIFLYYWNKYGHGRIIGVPHSTIRYWDLKHFDTIVSKAIPELPQPNLIAVNGQHAWKMLKDSGYSMKRCVPVEALRYQYLSKIKTVLLRNGLPLDRRRLLVLCDIQDQTTHHMLLQLEGAYQHLSEKVEVWIKPHPANTVDLKRYSKLSATLTNQSLMDLFPKVDVALASVFTSAALDAFCAGLPVINYLDPNDFNFSPLRDNPNARFISSSKDMLELLADKKWLTAPNEVKISNFFWLDERLSRWQNLIENSVFV